MVVVGTRRLTAKGNDDDEEEEDEEKILTHILRSVTFFRTSCRL
jgi:hypothetical protein